MLKQTTLTHQSFVQSRTRALGGHRRAPRKIQLSTNAAASEQAPANQPALFSHGITYTNYEVNSFAMKFNASGASVLVDPWFVGELTFLNQDWMYRGSKRVINRTSKVDINSIMAETDCIILTQELDDHCHMPTLKILPKDKLVVANPAAAAKIQPLGYSNILVIDHGQSVDVAGGRLRITATAGALVGPPWSKRQNGLVFQERAPAEQTSSQQPFKGASAYFEPHCDFDESSVSRVGQVDMVISPISSSLLGVGPVAYPLVMGDINLVKLLKILKPKVLVPLLNAEIDHTGPLAALIQDRGGYDKLRADLQAAGLTTKVEFPAPPCEQLAIAL